MRKKTNDLYEYSYDRHLINYYCLQRRSSRLIIKRRNRSTFSREKKCNSMCGCNSIMINFEKNLN